MYKTSIQCGFFAGQLPEGLQHDHPAACMYKLTNCCTIHEQTTIRSKNLKHYTRGILGSPGDAVGDAKVPGAILDRPPLTGVETLVAGAGATPAAGWAAAKDFLTRASRCL